MDNNRDSIPGASRAEALRAETVKATEKAQEKTKKLLDEEKVKNAREKHMVAESISGANAEHKKAQSSFLAAKTTEDRTRTSTSFWEQRADALIPNGSENETAIKEEFIHLGQDGEAAYKDYQNEVLAAGTNANKVEILAKKLQLAAQIPTESDAYRIVLERFRICSEYDLSEETLIEFETKDPLFEEEILLQGFERKQEQGETIDKLKEELHMRVSARVNRERLGVPEKKEEADRIKKGKEDLERIAETMAEQRPPNTTLKVGLLGIYGRAGDLASLRRVKEIISSVKDKEELLRRRDVIQNLVNRTESGYNEEEKNALLDKKSDTHLRALLILSQYESALENYPDDQEQLNASIKVLDGKIKEKESKYTQRVRNLNEKIRDDQDLVRVLTAPENADANAFLGYLGNPDNEFTLGKTEAMFQMQENARKLDVNAIGRAFDFYRKRKKDLGIFASIIFGMFFNEFVDEFQPD